MNFINFVTFNASAIEDGGPLKGNILPLSQGDVQGNKPPQPDDNEKRPPSKDSDAPAAWHIWAAAGQQISDTVE